MGAKGLLRAENSPPSTMTAGFFGIITSESEAIQRRGDDSGLLRRLRSSQ